VDQFDFCGGFRGFNPLNLRTAFLKSRFALATALCIGSRFLGVLRMDLGLQLLSTSENHATGGMLALRYVDFKL
jgi:hypothetical protein